MKRFHQLDGLELWSALPSMERILGFDGSLKKNKEHVACVWYGRTRVYFYKNVLQQTH